MERLVVRDNGLQGVKLWSGGVVENCLIASNGLDGLVFVYDGAYRVANTAVANNSPEYRAYSVCAGYPEPEPLGGQGDLRDASSRGDARASEPSPGQGSG